MSLKNFCEEGVKSIANHFFILTITKDYIQFKRLLSDSENPRGSNASSCPLAPIYS